MKTCENICVTIDNERVEFVRGVDAGYRRKNMLLVDMPNGDVLAIYRVGREWIEAVIRDGICRGSLSHRTQRDALISAATSVVSARLNQQSFWRKLQANHQSPRL